MHKSPIEQITKLINLLKNNVQIKNNETYKLDYNLVEFSLVAINNFFNIANDHLILKQG